MIRKVFIVVAAVLLVASVGCAENIFEVVTSAVKATFSGVNKTVSNANPGKIASDTVEGTGEASQKAVEATASVATIPGDVVNQAAGGK